MLIFFVKKLFISLLFPPGIFIVLFLFIAIYIKKVRKFFLGISVLVYLLSTTLVGTYLIKPLENKYTLPKQLPPKIDAVVVLSGGNNYGMSNNLPLMPSAFKRFVYGVSLAKEYTLPLLFTGGNNESKAALTVVSELRNIFDIKLAKTKIIKHKFLLYYEDKSKTTYENALFSKVFFLKSGIKKPTILLVTSAFHMPRSVLLFKKHGFQVIPAPTDYKSYFSKQLFFLPSMSGLQQSYFALHEYLGYLRYKFCNISQKSN